MDEKTMNLNELVSSEDFSTLNVNELMEVEGGADLSGYCSGTPMCDSGAITCSSKAI
jgi:bacteriocin-like protein